MNTNRVNGVKGVNENIILNGISAKDVFLNKYNAENFYTKYGQSSTQTIRELYNKSQEWKSILELSLKCCNSQGLFSQYYFSKKEMEELRKGLDKKIDSVNTDNFIKFLKSDTEHSKIFLEKLLNDVMGHIEHAITGGCLTETERIVKNELDSYKQTLNEREYEKYKQRNEQFFTNLGKQLHHLDETSHHNHTIDCIMF